MTPIVQPAMIMIPVITVPMIMIMMSLYWRLNPRRHHSPLFSNRSTLAAYLNYRLDHKNVALYFCPYLRQLMTDFENSFTDTLCGQFPVMWLLYTPPCHKCISTLPCEIWMQYVCITIVTNKYFGKIEKKTLWFDIAANDLYNTRLCGCNTV